MMICGYQNERAINVIRDNFPGVTKPIRLQNKGNRLIKESCNTLFEKKTEHFLYLLESIYVHREPYILRLSFNSNKFRYGYFHCIKLS